MRPQLRLLLLLVIACLSWTARPQIASAQTVTIPQALGFEIIRKDQRPTSELPLVISTQDCLDDDPTEENYNEVDGSGARTWIELNLAISDPNTRYTLEFWASQTADCTDINERTGTSPRCREIGPSQQANLLAKEVALYPRPILTSGGYAGDPTSVDDYPDESTCDDEQENALVIWVLLFNGETLLDSATWENSSIDTLPPPTPSSLSAGPGDERLFLDWDIPSENEEDDTDGFSFFCQEIQYASGDTTANGGAGGESFADCSLDYFNAGELTPPDGFTPCGSSNGRSARDGQTSALVNGTPYAVYVTSTDTVGNISDASNLGCATPQEVVTFFDEYKESGGRGGGGFCAISGGTQTSLWLLLAFAVILFAVRRRGRLS